MRCEQTYNLNFSAPKSCVKNRANIQVQRSCASFCGVKESILPQVQKCFSELAKENIESATLNRLRYKMGLCSFKNPLSRAGYIIHSQCLDEKIHAIRTFMQNVPVGSHSEYVNILEKLVKKYKVGNCGEMSLLLQNMLETKGVQARQVLLVNSKDVLKLNADNKLSKGFPKYSSHSIVVCGIDNILHNMVTMKELLKMPNIIILDPWLNVIFKTSHLAEKYYQALFGMTKQDFAIDITNSAKMNTTNMAESLRKAKQQSMVAHLDSVIKKIESTEQDVVEDYFSKYGIAIPPDSIGF